MDYFISDDNFDTTKIRGHNYFGETISDSIYKIELEEESNNDDREFDSENGRRTIK